MLGQPISMVLPKVVGYKMTGTPNSFITSTDIVLTITKVSRLYPHKLSKYKEVVIQSNVIKIEFCKSTGSCSTMSIEQV